MQQLAEQIGGEWNGNELVVDGKVHEKFYDVRNELERQDDLLKNTISETEYISDELSKSQSALEQHSYELNTKVSYVEMNGTNKTLEKLLTEFSQTADGFNFRIDSNGMIQDLTFDKNAFKLNSNLIEFNDGDVVIKDGKTTIKDAFIHNLASDNAFIQKLASDTAFIDVLNSQHINSNEVTSEVGDNKTTIHGGFFESSGTYRRTWLGNTSTNQIDIRVENGYVRARNNTKNWS